MYIYIKSDQYLIPDTSVHCLHILRVITDDTSLKPFTREFYNIIIGNRSFYTYGKVIAKVYLKIRKLK